MTRIPPVTLRTVLLPCSCLPCPQHVASAILRLRQFLHLLKQENVSVHGFALNLKTVKFLISLLLSILLHRLSLLWMETSCVRSWCCLFFCSSKRRAQF